MLEQYLELGHDCFISYPFQYVIHPIMCYYTVSATDIIVK
jgi:hypothetical protein